MKKKKARRRKVFPDPSRAGTAYSTSVVVPIYAEGLILWNAENSEGICNAGFPACDLQTESLHYSLNSSTNRRFDVFHSVFEYPQSLSFARPGAAGPGGVLDGIDEAFGVRHEAEDQAAGIADACDVVNAAVGIVRRLAVGR